MQVHFFWLNLKIIGRKIIYKEFFGRQSCLFVNGYKDPFFNFYVGLVAEYRRERLIQSGVLSNPVLLEISLL